MCVWCCVVGTEQHSEYVDGKVKWDGIVGLAFVGIYFASPYAELDLALLPGYMVDVG